MGENQAEKIEDERDEFRFTILDLRNTGRKEENFEY